MSRTTDLHHDAKAPRVDASRIDRIYQNGPVKLEVLVFYERRLNNAVDENTFSNGTLKGYDITRAVYCIVIFAHS
jgi:hypothetical protein